MDLIFCAGRNRRYAELALAAGFRYGCRSDYRPLFPVHFADLDWKAPDCAVRERHLGFVAEHRPRIAVAPDVLDADALPATLRYAERLAAHADAVVVTPKVYGVLARLPREPWLRVGYSVPTTYGGPGGVLPLEYLGRAVHLLGGSPSQQLRLAQYLTTASADGNVTMKAAGYGSYWERGRWKSKTWTFRGPDFPYRAFERSCANIAAAWRER